MIRVHVDRVRFPALRPFMKLFIWDFHGTLEKGNERAVREISNRVLEARGYKERFSDELTHRLYGKKWYEFFMHVLPELEQPDCIELQEECILLQKKEPEIIERRIEADDHAIETLATIAKAHDQILISGTRSDALTMFIRVTGLDTYFPYEKCFGIDSHREDPVFSKEDIAQKYMIEKEFEKIIVIGDSPKDMIPLPNSVKYLFAREGREFRDCKADYRIRDLREVLREV